MTNTYNTLNPLGSTSPKDLFDNASNFDEAMNSASPSFYDRFMQRRETWSGMQKMVADFLEAQGFEATHLQYVDGNPLTVLRPTQLIDRAPSVYKVKAPATFPVNLTGTWATDQLLLVDVGDAPLRSELANAVNLALGATMVGRAVRHIDTIAQLKTIAGRYNDDIVVVARQASGFNFGGGPFLWDSASVLTPNDVTVIQTTGITTGRWIRLTNQALSGAMFGMRALVGFDNTTAMAAIETFLRGELAAYRPLPRVEIGAGTYSAVTCPNWGIQGATIVNIGKVKLRATGGGSAMILDAGATFGVNITGLTFGQGNGFILECGPTATADTLYVRNVYLGEIRARVWGGGLTQAGVKILGSVLAKFYIGTTPTESANEDPAEYINGWYLGGKPQFGKIVSESAVGAQTSYCIFYNWIGAACQYGMYIDSTLGNLWQGGDNEYNTASGAIFTANAFLNRIRGTNHEVNTNDDIQCLGSYNSFDCDTVLLQIVSGDGNRLIGGTHNQVNNLTPATGSYIGEIVYGRGLSGNLVINDTGIKTAFGMCFQAQSKTWSRGPRLRNAVAGVTVTSYTYTNNRGRAVMLFVNGGTVSVATYYRDGTPVGPVGTTNFAVLVQPGDSIILLNSVVPTLIELEA